MFKNKNRNASDNFEFPMCLGTCLDINIGNTVLPFSVGKWVRLFVFVCKSGKFTAIKAQSQILAAVSL